MMVEEAKDKFVYKFYMFCTHGHKLGMVFNSNFLSFAFDYFQRRMFSLKHFVFVAQTLSACCCVRGCLLDRNVPNRSHLGT